MFITISRSGGFTGLRQRYTIDTEQLAEADAARIAQLVGRLPAQAERAPGADRLRYRVTVDRGGHVSTHYLGEGQVVNALIAAARPVTGDLPGALSGDAVPDNS